MRKVNFKKWIPAEYVQDATKLLGKKQLDNTNCWEKDFLHEGLFHQWGNAYEESTAGFGNYTVALIEMPDGTIESVLPDNVRFSESEPTREPQ